MQVGPMVDPNKICINHLYDVTIISCTQNYVQSCDYRDIVC